MTPKPNFTLMHDYVMVYPVAKSKTTTNGIIITERTDPTAPIEGFVVGVGPGKQNVKGEMVPILVQAGDRVIFIGNAGKIVKHEGDSFIVVPVSEILCKIGYDKE